MSGEAERGEVLADELERADRAIVILEQALSTIAGMDHLMATEIAEEAMREAIEARRGEGGEQDG